MMGAGGRLLVMLLACGALSHREAGALPLSTAALERELAALYGRPPVASVWLGADGRPSSAAFTALTLLGSAGDDALPPERYDASALQGLARSLAGKPKPADAAARRFDRKLSSALIRWLHDLRLGQVAPGSVHEDIHLPLRRFSPSALIVDALRENRVAELARLGRPALALYPRLRNVLARYRRLARSPLPPLPDVRKLAPGDAWRGLESLRQRLVAFGDMAASAPPAPRYEAEIVAAVRRFQARHGLVVDGIIGRRTLAALRVSPAARARQVALAMERVRWLPQLDADRVIGVNIPAFRLWALSGSDGDPVVALDSAVVVGRSAQTRTPVFIGSMRWIEFNPYWNVPYSITIKELLPKLRTDRDYLTRNDMELVNGGRPSQVVGPHDLAGLVAGTLRIRQRPGDQNALGRVKFVLPNSMSIYLHDTPAKALFGRPRRDFSHGCIRVEQPSRLAAFLLADLPGWDAARIHDAMTADTTLRVDLSRAVPVVIFYVTASVARDGMVAFYDDIYGYDASLEAALERRH
ncbi:MAG: L,D-transpeptidase family protein [Burkholderiaceae bacterium]|nr:L,D-transpeptidase family protein [Burkholderiaceae bacterium]